MINGKCYRNVAELLKEKQKENKPLSIQEKTAIFRNVFKRTAMLSFRK